MNRKKLVREQLDGALQRLSPLRRVHVPPKGWIRAIRDGLGMTARQLADRLGVAQQSVARIEKHERTGSVTIKTMQRVAECLACESLYAFIPRSSLEEMIRRQASLIAEKRLEQASQTMLLEDQGLTGTENEIVLHRMIEEEVGNFQ